MRKQGKKTTTTSSATRGAFEMRRSTFDIWEDELIRREDELSHEVLAGLGLRQKKK